ncbi:unnamed protein product [Ambrosiozyma monospora]|uniref:Unnamed protein product n=1 Tax=Ambrosiozyma monospora TaxID=43982 RepID=A0ACB5SSV2_AMBMO|nr:unnamed protein product [Ambrosiozyma monospora]
MVALLPLTTAAFLFFIRPGYGDLATLDDYDSEVADQATFAAVLDDLFEYKDYYYTSIDSELYEEATSLYYEAENGLSSVSDYDTTSLDELSTVITSLFSELRVSDYFSIQDAITNSYIEEYSYSYGTTPTITDFTYATATGSPYDVDGEYGPDPSSTDTPYGEDEDDNNYYYDDTLYTTGTSDYYDNDDDYENGYEDGYEVGYNDGYGDESDDDGYDGAEATPYPYYDEPTTVDGSR